MSDTVRWVRIVSTPAGEAPLWVREAWVGVELPDFGEVIGAYKFGHITGRKVQTSPHDFAVSSQKALDALRKKNPTAAQWFKDNVVIMRRFIFNESAIKFIPSPSPPTTEIQELS